MKRLLMVIGATATLIMGSIGGGLVAQSSKQRDLEKSEQDIVKDFVTRFGRLALQYEQSGSSDKAKHALGMILKVAPNDETVKRQMDRIEKQELSENRKVVKVLAQQSWQDTGLVVSAGKPVAISAQGQWVFKMSRSVGPEGMDVPEEMKRFPLGALIGVVDPSGGNAESKKERQRFQPFLVGSQDVITPNASGRLFLKMHDTDESDNAGQLVVTVSGSVRDN